MILLETVIAMAVVALALLRPKFAHSWLRSFERGFCRLAQRKTSSVLLAGVLPLVLRLVLLPVLPVPAPSFQDDFSYLLAADTFAHHRLANPPHPMWQHFESFHIIFQPTYASMYPPAQGLLLFVGKLMGHPFIGVLLSLVGMGSAICWMLQGWMPPQWALLGALLAGARLTTFTYWGNSYCGGALAAIGGALLLGALPRVWRTKPMRHSIIAALGVMLLANCRPYEGLLLAVTALACLVLLLIAKKPKSSHVVSMVLPAGIILTFAALAISGYNFRVTGNVGLMPYQVNRAEYGTAPYFIWQTLNHRPPYRHQAMQRFYTDIELAAFLRMKSIPGFLRENAFRLLLAWAFYFGPLLTISLVWLPWMVRDRRIRWLLTSGLVVLAGVSVVSFFIPHYLATITGVFVAVAVQGLRHIRAGSRHQGSPGGSIARSVPLACLIFVPIHALMLISYSATEQPTMGVRRAQVVSTLNQRPGDHLIFVHYDPKHDPLEEWVYNGAEIDAQKIIWARDMGDEENQELIQYYAGRKPWIVKPDQLPVQPSEYRQPLNVGN